MTGPLAQIIALTSFGNQYLITGYSPQDFYENNTVFRGCQSVDFREFKRLFFFSRAKEKVVAAGPTAWFSYLKEQGCLKLRLYYEASKDQTRAKDHQLAGLVGGGGTWLIEAVYNKTSTYWGNRWLVTHKDDPERIWSVNYGAVIQRQPVTNQQIDTAKAKQQLQQALDEIYAFAKKTGEPNWANVFSQALSALEKEYSNDDDFLKDLLPLEHYSLIAKQLISAASMAWVFGGMGSWNDIGFEKDEDVDEYERTSEQLYEAINKAIIAAVNSY